MVHDRAMARHSMAWSCCGIALFADSASASLSLSGVREAQGEEVATKVANVGEEAAEEEAEEAAEAAEAAEVAKEAR